MALDVALVLRLVNRLSGPIKQPIRDTRQLGGVAESAQRALARFGGQQSDIQKLGMLSAAAGDAGTGIRGVATAAERGADRISSIRSDIEHFRSLRREVTETQSAMRAAQARAADLGGQLSAARGASAQHSLSASFEKQIKLARSGQLDELNALRQKVELAPLGQIDQGAIEGLESHYKTATNSATRHFEKLNQMRRAAQLEPLGSISAIKTGELKELERSLNGASAASKRLKEQHIAQRRTLDLVRGTLRGAGVDTRDLANATKELSRREREHIETMRQQERMAERLTNRRERLARLSERAERFAGQRQRLRGHALETAAIGYGASRFIQGAGQSQSKLTEIGITGEMTLEERKELRTEIGDIRRRTSGSERSELLEAMSALTASGISSENSRKALEPMARTAFGGFAELPDVARSTIALFQNLDIPMERLQSALDMQAKGGQIGAFELKDMAVEFPAITAIAQSQNITGEEGLASLIAAAQIARPAAASSAGAATLLTNLLGKIDAPDTVRNFEEFGINLIERLQEYDASGINRLEAITKLTMEARDEGARTSELFGDRETKQMMNQMLSNWETYQRFKTEVLSESGGTVDASYSDRQENDPTGRWTDLREDVSEIRDKFAMPLLEVITEVTAKIGPLAERFSTWASENQKLIGLGVKVVMVLLAMKIAVLALGFTFGWMGGAALLALSALTRLGIGSALMKLRVLAILPLLSKMGYGLGFMVGRALWGVGALSLLAGRFMGLKRLAPLRWASLIPKLSWGGSLLPKIGWAALAGKLSWGLLITPLKWGARLIPVIGWALLLGELAWSLIIKPLGWDKYLPRLDWSEFLNAFSWDGWLPSVEWSKLIPKVTWPDWIKALDWSALIKVIDWASWIFPIRWLDLIPGFEWSEIIKAVNWQGWFAFEWSSVLPKWDWSRIIPKLPSLSSLLGDERSEIATRALKSIPNALPKLVLAPAPVALDGQRAAGGPVRAGGTYLVGERGPELLRMGRDPGFVLPSALSMALLSAPLAAQGIQGTPGANGIQGAPISIDVLTVQGRLGRNGNDGALGTPGANGIASAASAALSFAEAGAGLKIIKHPPLPQSPPGAAGGQTSISLTIAPGAITVQSSPDAKPEELGREVLEQIVSKAAPMLQRALGHTARTGAELHDGPELFDE